MGDRCSVSFAVYYQKEYSKSIALFDHWGGHRLVHLGKKFMKDLLTKTGGDMNPLDRFEPNTVMLNFILWLEKQMKSDYYKYPIKSGFYLGKDEHDGDNSDRGHFIFEIDHATRTYKIYHIRVAWPEEVDEKFELDE